MGSNEILWTNEEKLLIEKLRIKSAGGNTVMPRDIQDDLKKFQRVNATWEIVANRIQARVSGRDGSTFGR